MISIPFLKRLENKTQLKEYSAMYLRCSGLPIPERYLQNPNNRVYAIQYNNEMIGGFILGKGQSLRTLEVFARPEDRLRLYESLGETSEFTEITCFWIAPKYRKHTSLNTFTWLSLAYTLRRFSNPKILFGTCSASLARLYGVTPKSQLIHKDFVNGKRTFIFQSERKVSVKGFLEILRFKFNRTAKIHRKRQGNPLRRAV